ncbi:hypothetical protein BJF81_15545 [Ornithinimicrobium sp. CNJ-824]|uniref:hypothetical protein n=1 Tax=Ornithinimicrobium sp. CNJ-824 TaxID=1904966 RepID=UPI000960B774|nr:hypothetical protein [Ornithinimicrobium sp. CNJ-824]OLT21238.1 hypothetical protein BJF81_15545 [Ornithinimicrobium sp. CNJ-824]
MWTTELTARQKANVLLAVAALLAAILATGLLLQEHGPGNMGTGFLQGAGVALVAAAVTLWRVTRRPERTTTFERAFTQTGDERDDSVLTRALAVLGLTAPLLTTAAVVVIGLGAETMMALFFLLVGQIAVGAVAFAFIARRS